MAKAKFENPFADMFKGWGDYNINNQIDWDRFVNAGRKNAKALAAFSQLVTESAQAIGRRQAEIAQEATESVVQLTKDLVSSANSPEASVARQAEFARNNLQNAISNSRELLETVSKSNAEGFELLNKRMTEVFSDFGNYAATTNSSRSNQNQKQNDQKKSAA